MMNDEIKEKMTIGKAKKILRGFLAKDCYYDTPLYYAIPYLLDYITNLQHTEDLYNQLLKDYDELEQSYQELKDSKQWWTNRFNAVQRDYEELKQENERLKNLVNPKTQIFIDTQDMEERYGEELYKEYLEKQVKDYKSRCEKADEKIKKHLYDKKFLNNTHTDEQMLNIVSNILNGKGSDE